MADGDREPRAASRRATRVGGLVGQTWSGEVGWNNEDNHCLLQQEYVRCRRITRVSVRIPPSFRTRLSQFPYKSYKSYRP